MGLRFLCVVGWGWVAGMGGRAAGRAHRLEKSAARFTNTSIHRLFEGTLRNIARTTD
jgi:hypothetical protein